MIVTFYTFSKRINSTAQPGSGTDYTVVLKEPSSVISPRLDLIWTGTGSPTAFNYAYISEFSRYYWIDNWEYQDRKWTCSLSVDVLATYRVQIGASEKYVLRSAKFYDPLVLDNYYPSKGETNIVRRHHATPWRYTDFDDGWVILSVAGQNTGAAFVTGGAGYVAYKPAAFQQLLNFVFNYDDQTTSASYSSSDFGASIVEGIRRLQVTVKDPKQYLGTARWYPCTPPNDGVDYTLTIANIATNIPCRLVSDPIFEYTRFNILYDGTLTGTEMAWEKMSPFRRALLWFPPFGLTELDTSRLIGHDTISFLCKVDVISGSAICEVGLAHTVAGSTYYAPLTTLKADFGIAIDIGGVNPVGNIGSALTSAIGGAAAAVTGNLPGTALALASAASAMLPTVSGAGTSGGGYVGLSYDNVELWEITYTHPAEDITEMGRPLAQVKKLVLFDGYVLCQDGDIEAPATPGELRQIESFLTGGFFYD